VRCFPWRGECKLKGVIVAREGVPPIVALRENNVGVGTGFFESEQFEAVCSRLGEVEADVAGFCYHMGSRTKSEVFPLTWAQVDWNGGLIRLEPGTTKNPGLQVKTMTKSWRTAARTLVRGAHCSMTLGAPEFETWSASVSRSVAMKMTGNKTEPVYRRYAIVSEGDLREAGLKLAAVRPTGDSLRG
jgi:integrase